MTSAMLRDRVVAIVLGLLLALSASGEPEARIERLSEAERDGDVTRVLRPSHIDAERATDFLRRVGPHSVQIWGDPTLAVVGMVGDRAQLDRVEELLTALNRMERDRIAGKRVAGETDPAPPPDEAKSYDIEFTVHLILGVNAFGTADDGTLPDSVKQSVAALKEAFPYAGYRYADALFARGRTGGEFSTSGVLTLDDEDIRCSFGIGEISVSEKPGRLRIVYQRDGEWVPADESSRRARIVQVENLRFSATVPMVVEVVSVGEGAQGLRRVERRDVVVTTTADLPESTLVLAGKTSFGEHGALFILVSAEVLD